METTMAHPALSAVTTTTSPSRTRDFSSNNLPSPTLTNPDMILPYENEPVSSTPSPPFRPLQLPSPDRSALQNNGGHGNGHGRTPSADSGYAVSLPENMNSTPTPPRNNNSWMYAGHEIGPPLSDIGEEDSCAQSQWSDGDCDDTESEITGNAFSSKAQWHSGASEDDCDTTDTCSSASDSTVGAQHEHREQWEENSSGNGSRNSASSPAPPKEGQHDNNEEGEFKFRDLHSSDVEGYNMAAIAEEEEGDSGEDTISKEAERILEYAKKRLTHMEGNLTRARSSLRMTPSPSPSNMSFGGISRTVSRTERRAQTSLAGALLRQRASQQDGNNFHSRNLSDIYSSSTRGASPRDNRPTFRSFSALGSTSAFGFGASDLSRTSPREEGFRRRLSTRASVSLLQSPIEETRKPAESQSDSSSKHSPPPESSPKGHSDKASKVPKSMEEFNSAYPASPPSRSHSQLQVRGLQDQMHDLKNKISSLKVKAQEDSMRRRSIQSLRTPSPFTSAEEWYTSAAEYRNGAIKGQLNLNDSSLNVLTAGKSVESDEHKEQQQQQCAEDDLSSPAPEQVPNVSDHPRADDEQSVSESHYEDADEVPYDEGDDYSSGSEIDREALAEILNEPSPVDAEQDILEAFPPVPQVPEATPHEDREDAFDYEHFFLHSALGNYSKERYRRPSYSSDASAETTRPASQTAGYTSPRTERGRHARTNSGDSISTAATFATATEGMESSDDEGYDVAGIDNALYWNGNGASFYSGRNQHNRTGSGSRKGRYDQSRNSLETVNANGDGNRSSMDAESNNSTPRTSMRRSSHSSRHSGRKSYQHLDFPTPPGNASRSSLDGATLISSLISAAAAQYAPDGRAGNPASSQLSKEDAEVLESVLQSLGKVGLQLQLCSTGEKRSSADEKSSLLFRRRLDAAKRVLEGQLDI